MIAVANAGPCIALARIGSLGVLPQLFQQIYLPQAVYHEIVSAGVERSGAQEIALASWILRQDVQNTTAVHLLRERLDHGESEAIVLALELQADVLLIDEARGRRIAEARGLKKTGTLGVLVLAKQRGLIPDITPLLNALIASGFRMDDALYAHIQRLAGE